MLEIVHKYTTRPATYAWAWKVYPVVTLRADINAQKKWVMESPKKNAEPRHKPITYLDVMGFIDRKEIKNTKKVNWSTTYRTPNIIQLLN